MSNTTVTRSHDVVVVGGGQAGLAIGYYLAQAGPGLHDPRGRRRAGRRVARALGFAEAVHLCALRLPAGACRFPGDPDRYPTEDEVADYLTDYARHFELPVELGAGFGSVRQSDDGYLVELDDRSIEADQVVIATGPFQTPFVPPIAEALGPEVAQMHSTAYRSPRGHPRGPGARRRRRQHRLPDRRRAVGLARGPHLDRDRAQKPLPQRILGRDLFWYLDKTGLIRKTKDTRIGRRLQENEDTLIGSRPRTLARHGVVFHPRALDAAGSTVTFSDGTDARGRHRDLGNRLPPRPFVGRPAGVRRGRPGHPRARGDRVARPVLHRPALAAHARLGAARLRQGRRRVPGAADRAAAAASTLPPLLR